MKTRARLPELVHASGLEPESGGLKVLRSLSYRPADGRSHAGAQREGLSHALSHPVTPEGSRT
jgi:hypothetical protein